MGSCVGRIWLVLLLLLLGGHLLLEVVGEVLRDNGHRDQGAGRSDEIDNVFVRCCANIFAVDLKMGLIWICISKRYFAEHKTYVKQKITRP